LTGLGAAIGIFDKHCNDLVRRGGGIAKGEAVV